MNEKIVISAIDVGTNSFHMVTASVNENGMLDIISRDKVMVRLGSSSGDMKYLQRDSIKRAVRTLKAFAKIAENENASIRAVATSAVREADNKDEFIEIVKNETGIDIEVVSGVEEGRLIAIGVLNALPLLHSKMLTIDIGGGSTETIVAENGEMKHIQSTKIGTIRLTKKYFDDVIPDEQSINKCKEFIRGEWSVAISKIKKIGIDTVVGTSGTMNTLIGMAYLKNNKLLPEIQNGIEVETKDVLKVIKKIKKAAVPDKIKKLKGMDPQRADIILAGALILEVAIEELNIEKFTQSSFALREGILFDTVEKTKNLERYAHLSELRYRTIINLCEKYDVDIKHSEHVKKLSTKIFDELVPLHKKGNYERELLEAAAYLHDVGFHISHDKHHKHSFYLIKNSVMTGFTNDEAELIANIARYHRKSHPKKKHNSYKMMSKEKQEIVWLLGGILRIAEGLDRRQIQNVENLDININETDIEINLISNYEQSPDIELWGAKRRKSMLEKFLLKDINFKII